MPGKTRRVYSISFLLRSWPRSLFSIFVVILALLWGTLARAQTCLGADDMDPSTATALTNAAENYFQMIAHGDSATLEQNAIPSVAANFSGIQTAVRDNQSALAGAKAVARPPYLLQAEGTAPLARAEFLCGVFGPSGQTAHSAVFQIPNLPPGNYGFVVQDVSTGKAPYTIAYVLQQEGKAWKLGGLYIKPTQVAGHDGNWFAEKARAFKAKGQNLSAWFYYTEARELLVPVPFMSTMVTDKLYDEAQTVKPADLPPSDLVANGKTYQLTALFPLPVANDFDVVVKYRSADVSDAAATYQNNVAVMKALLAKHPELRSAFDGVIARAVEPSGRDYGTMLAMQDIK